MQLYDEKMLEETLEFVKSYQLSNGKSPSYRTIMARFSSFYPSVSKVERYIRVLKERGAIEKNSDGSISICDALSVGRTRTVSLVGQCACGQPILAEENIEGTFSLPEDLLGKGEYFMLRAIGSSMIDAGIFDKDYMFVRKQENAEEGQIVIALVDGQDATAKRFYRRNGKIILHPENDTEIDGKRIYEDIVVDNCEIVGVVTNVWHSVH